MGKISTHEFYNFLKLKAQRNKSQHIKYVLDCVLW